MTTVEQDLSCSEQNPAYRTTRVRFSKKILAILVFCSILFIDCAIGLNAQLSHPSSGAYKVGHFRVSPPGSVWFTILSLSFRRTHQVFVIPQFFSMADPSYMAMPHSRDHGRLGRRDMSPVCIVACLLKTMFKFLGYLFTSRRLECNLQTRCTMIRRANSFATTFEPVRG